MRKSLQGKCGSGTGMDRYLPLYLQRIECPFPAYYFAWPFTRSHPNRLKPPGTSVILLKIMRYSKTFKPGSQFNRPRDVLSKEKV